MTGGAGFRNGGDEALLRAAAAGCARAAPGAALALLANNADEAAATLKGFDVELAPSPRFAFFRADDHYASADEVFVDRWMLLNAALVGRAEHEAVAALAAETSLGFIDRERAIAAYRAIAACDALVIHGGGILTSQTRSRLWEMALTARIAAGLGKRVLLRSQQLGPFDTARDREMARSILRPACYASVRDIAMSAVEAGRLAPEVEVCEGPDDALLLAMPSAQEAAVLKAKGLTAGAYIAIGYRHAPAAGMDDSAFAQVARMASVAQAALGCPLVLLPQGPFDLESLKRLRGLIGDARLIEPDDYLVEPMAIAAAARIMIAVPHHSLIFALRGGVPVISPVKGAYYRHKNIGSMRVFGLEDHVIDLDLPEAERDARFARLMVRVVDGQMSGSIAERIAALRIAAERTHAHFASALAGR